MRSWWNCRSQYVPVRDGTRLAVYVFRPAGPPGAPAPAVWAHDRYHQVTPGTERADYLAAVRSELDDAELPELGVETIAAGEVTLRAFPLAERLLVRGYAVVIVDSRGSGASFGTSDGPLAEVEAADTFDITEWIAAQPWCNGKVGMFGRSYLGISQYLAASTAPPHLVAIFPQMALFDLYSFAYDGGIFRDDFAREWGGNVRALDLSGQVASLDDDPTGDRLAAARADHRDSRDVYELFAALPHRDSRIPGGTEQPYLTRSPAAMLDAINRSGVAVYHLGGWYDVWARDAVRWTQSLTGPHKTVIGPWPHTGGLMGGAGYNLAEEHVRWFDYWLRGIDTGVMNEPPVRYHVLDSRHPWRFAEQWPPADIETVTWHLRSDGGLAPDPAAGADRRYVIDYTTTSGRNTRWASGYGAPFQRPDMTGNDARALCYTSAPLTADMEVVGEPVVRLPVRADDLGVDVFVYLEAVDPDGGSCYVTEGCAHLADQVGLAISLHPVGCRLQAGSRIRVAITGADADNAFTQVRDPAPVLMVRHDAGVEPALELPVVPAFMPAADAEAEYAPLSAAQRAIWLAEQLGTSGHAYHMRAELSLDGQVDRAALHMAFEEIIRRHSVLRTTIGEVDGQPMQCIHPPSPLEFPILDLSRAQVTATSWPLHEIVSRFVTRPWDLAREWPIRTATVALPDARTGLAIALHHIAADPGSVEVLFTELGVLYTACAAGRSSPLPEPQCQYSDLARRQQAELATPAAAALLSRWQDYLTGAPHIIDLPCDRPRAPGVDHGGGSVRFEVAGELADSVVRLAALHRTTVFAVLLTAFALALEAYGAGSDMLIATPSVQRDNDVTRQVIGCLVNVLPIRVRLAGECSAADVLCDVRNSVLTALRFRTVPFDTLVAGLKAKRRPEAPPLTQVLIRVGEPARRSVEIGDLRASRFIHETWGSVKYDLALAVDQLDGVLSGSLDYRRALFDAPTVERFTSSFVAILDQIVSDPDVRVDALWTMPRGDLRTVLDRWNPAPLPTEVARRFGVPGPARCYVLDRYGRPAPLNIPGDLHIAGTGELPDPYAGTENARMLATGMRFRWTPDGSLKSVSEPAVHESVAFQSEPTADGPPVTAPADLDDEVTMVIRTIWSELLKIDHISLDDDFFDLGGDSLFAIRYMSRIRKRFHVRLSLRDVFVGPTLSEQSLLVTSRRSM